LAFYRDIWTASTADLSATTVDDQTRPRFETICDWGARMRLRQDSNGPEKWMRMVRHFRETSFSVCVGTEFLAAPALAMGCDGIIAGLHNVCPNIAVDLFRSVCEGNLLRADQLQQRLIDLFSIFRVGGVWGAFEALSTWGFAKDPPKPLPQSPIRASRTRSSRFSWPAGRVSAAGVIGRIAARGFQRQAWETAVAQTPTAYRANNA
jgi:dihydrodipicolinate synthase/N-acetylneuraminate lyase